MMYRIEAVIAIKYLNIALKCVIKIYHYSNRQIKNHQITIFTRNMSDSTEHLIKLIAIQYFSEIFK